MNKQEVKIVARTFEIDDVASISGYSTEELESSTSSDLTMLAGKAAGVCYMPDDYFENGIQNEEKALQRAGMTAKSGHHSVYDHGQVTMVLKTNKMMAMILNSLGMYATSEKSARYTKMQPETELEMHMYDKWKIKIKRLIVNKYPDIDDVELRKRFKKKFEEYKGTDAEPLVIKGGKFEQCNDDKCIEILYELKQSDTLPSAKLAQENARYMISVFTPTTMMYTTSFRQLNLIISYLYKLAANLDNAEDKFSKSLLPHVKELLKALEDKIETKIIDNKNQHIRFLEAQHVGELVKEDKPGMTFKKFDNLERRLQPKHQSIGDSYTMVYFGSLAMLAQAQRHRTIRYTMLLQDPDTYGYYTPEIVKDAGLEKEWQQDIRSVGYCIPQGTFVRITEQGIFEDFALKCKERLCGRAQLEIMKSTAQNMKLFCDNITKLSYANMELLESMTVPVDTRVGREACARCKFLDFICSEGCTWGPNGALGRII